MILHVPHFKPLQATFTRLFLMLLFFLTCGMSMAMELQSVASGNDVLFKDLKGNGKWTLVMLWSTHCHVCHIDKPKISAFHDKHKQGDIEVVGIALDGIENLDTVKNYLLNNKVSFPSYVGNTAIIASHYYGMTKENLRGTPTYLLFNPKGELLGNNPGSLSTEAIERFIARNTESEG